MRYIRTLLMGIIGLILITLALANRQFVNLRATPELFEGLLGFSFVVTVPMFVVILGAVAFGIFIGFVWEWLREMKYRTAAQNEHRQFLRLEQEIKDLKSEQQKDKDGVLALLDKI